MRRIAAITIAICMAVTGIYVGIPQMDIRGADMTASAASYPALKSINYKATGNQRNDIVGFAKTQIGYKESGSNNTYFGSWFGCNYNPWCAMFVCWCAAKAGVSTSVIPRIATADRSWGKKQGVYYKSKYWGGSYTPKKGDLIYFSWSVRDYADHIGMVSGTGKENGTTYVYTIEGNKHDKVTEGSYAINNRYILGYISPKYTTNGTTKKTTTKAPPTTYTLKYRDGLDSTSNDEEDKIIAPVKGTFGQDLKLSSTRFERKDYAYLKWDVYRADSNDNLIYLCRDKETGTKEKWYKKSSIPDTYSQVTVKCGKKLNIKTAFSGTVYASPVWKKGYNVIYNANGGTGAPGAQIKTKGTSLTLSETEPTWEGHTFQGWATSKTATKADYASGGTYKKDAGVTLYAVWKVESTAKTYEALTTDGVNARTGPGTSYGVAGKIDAGTKVTVTEVSGNWAKLKDGNWVSLSYLTREDATEYTLEYTDGDNSTTNDSSVIPSVNVKYGKSVTTAEEKFKKSGNSYSKWKIYRLKDAEKFWYCKDTATDTIEGWYTEKKIPSDYKMVTVKTGGSFTITEPAGDRIFITPVWKTEDYTVSYDANGGKSAPAAQTKEPGKELTLSSKKPTREGYEFKGWAVSSDSDKVKYKSGAKYSKDASLDLYAVWELIPYQVKLTRKINRREGPGKNYGIQGTLKKGRVVTIIDKDNGWGKMQKTGLWIMLKYTKKVSGTTDNTKKAEKDAAPAYDGVFTVKVSAKSGINVRSGPSKSKKIVGRYEKGKKLKIKKVENGWGKLKKSGNWVMLKYTNVVSGYRVRITDKDLNQRKGPGTKYDVKGTIKPGTYDICKISGDWGKISKTGYWVCLAYTKRVK